MPIESGTVTGRMLLSAPSKNEEITIISASSSSLPAASYAEVARNLGKGSPSGQINKSIHKSSNGQRVEAAVSAATADGSQLASIYG